MERLTAAEMKAVANRLAWTDGSAEEAVMTEFEVDPENLDLAMSLCEYEWDCKLDLWVSKRDIWCGWDGALPSESETT